VVTFAKLVFDKIRSILSAFTKKWMTSTVYCSSFVIIPQIIMAKFINPQLLQLKTVLNDLKIAQSVGLSNPDWLLKYLSAYEYRN
jgi:hypothetical protein